MYQDQAGQVSTAALVCAVGPAQAADKKPTIAFPTEDPVCIGKRIRKN
jgi:hypothetical protein